MCHPVHHSIFIAFLQEHIIPYLSVHGGLPDLVLDLGAGGEAADVDLGVVRVEVEDGAERPPVLVVGAQVVRHRVPGHLEVARVAMCRIICFIVFL